jgi:hypothetical protein
MQEVILLDNDSSEAATTAEPPRRHPRQKPALERGLLVFHPDFGFGKIVATQGNKIVVKFGKTERVTREPDLVTRVEAKVNWHTYWLRGEKRRLLEGRLLWIVKGLCRRHGEWQAFLDRYDYPRSTADDLTRRYKAAMAEEPKTQESPGNRAIQAADPDRHVNERTPDSEADEREESVRQEAAKRRGKNPTYHKTLWSIRIKLPPDVLTLCRRRYKQEPNAAKKFWRRAAYRFVDLDPDHNSHSQDDESESSE